MGDIYHSQIVEVGAPDANVRFRGTNEELIIERLMAIKILLQLMQIEQMYSMQVRIVEFYML